MSLNTPKPDSGSLMHSIEMSIRKEQQDQIKSSAETLIQGFATGDKNCVSMSLGMLMGQVQMAQAVESFATIGSLQTLKRIKETKEYKHLKGIRMPSGEVLNGTWEDFCRLIGQSKSNVDERIINLDTFGETALKNMQAIGMGIRDLRRLRQLPPGELVTLIEGDELKVQDREEALIIIEEMAAKHRQETNKLKETVENLEQSSKASDQLLEKKGKQIQELEKELEIAKCANSPAKVKQLEAERNKILSTALITAKFDVFKGLAAFEDAVLAIQACDHPNDMDDEYNSGMREIISRLMEGTGRSGLDQIVFDTLRAELVVHGGMVR